MKLSISYDSLGILSSALCMIHCIGTPFLFIAKACSTTCCSEAPLWWLIIDYIFLIISFFAIYSTTKNKIEGWLKIFFWITWIVLLIATMDHSFNILLTPKYFIYIPALTVVALHFYKLKYSKYSNENCSRIR